MATRTRARPKQPPAAPAASEPQGITKITVKGFKSLAEETSIEIRPLTILAGANSSGKSSIMQPLLLLKQTLEAPFDPGGLLLSGPHVSLTKAEQLLARTGPRRRADAFEVTLETANEVGVADVFGPDRQGLALTETRVYMGGEPIVLRPRMTHEELAAQLGEDEEADRRRVSAEGGDDLKWSVGRGRCFLRPRLGNAVEPLWFAGRGNVLLALLEGHLSEVIHLPGGRGLPERYYPQTATGPTFPGPFPPYTASVILEWQEAGAPQHAALEEAMEQLGLAWKVEARRIDAAHIELLVPRLPAASRAGTPDMVSVADVGSAVSESLPILVALLAADEGRLVYIEQPEIDLHPRAQVALAKVLVEAANRGVRVVAETHSDLLLLGLQTEVAAGRIKPEEVILHWFRRGDDGVTEVDSTGVGGDGAFLTEWPEDFASVALRAQREYLVQVQARRDEARHAR